MAFALITANTEWAISLDEAREHLAEKATDSDSDAYIQHLIEAVHEDAEDFYDLGLTEQTLELYFDDFPQVIEIWKWPVASIESVKYTDGDGNTQTVTSTNYSTDLVSKPARIAPANNYTWPVVGDYLNAVQVQFKTGFTLPATIPSGIKEALLLEIADRFDSREDKGRRFNRVSEMRLMRYKYR